MPSAYPSCWAASSAGAERFAVGAGREFVITAQRIYDTTAYRYPHERLILALTLLLVLAVVALTATATVCLSVVFIAAIVAFSYAKNQAHHRALLEQAQPITLRDTPELAVLVEESIARLQTGDVRVFVAPGDTLNAYTFGLLPPKVVVLHSALLQVMDEDELRFILGHELGHVRLGHTWLNSLVGGMAGIPSPFLASTILTMAFLWWNRACEVSADRAGLLACSKPHKAISALIKLAAGPSVHTQADLKQALQYIEAEDDHALSNLGEALATHPMMIRRIEQLQRYAASAEYRRLQALVNRNVVAGRRL
ncbi:MAG: M48 family metallopeptidase [Chloroflexi bacterium]|nr:M48 family metallopeptidase [Chloroflexota bacterium]